MGIIVAVFLSVIVIVVILLALSICASASNADDITEDIIERESKRNGQKSV